MTDRPLFLIVVCDGLRLDMVTAKSMPNLHRFMAENTTFPHARAVFPASTRTNAAALATGATPRRNGIMHNKYYDPNVFTDRMFRPNNAGDIAAAMAACAPLPMSGLQWISSSRSPEMCERVLRRCRGRQLGGWSRGRWARPRSKPLRGRATWVVRAAK